MAMRKYAEQVMKWFENPADGKNHKSHKQLMQNLVTRDDVPDKKKLVASLFPCDERMMIIINDSIHEWPAETASVLQIREYLFWP